MGNLRFYENIIRLRRKMGITQDELAAFLRVTKASVSKWETKQSYPDILLLPQIAAYFDVSIDELLGYESQISPEQIMKCYQDLADDFAKLPFDEVVDKSRKLVKEYYSCYPLLM
jgi:transcriptional regulator with XRE-family HTH domain